MIARHGFHSVTHLRFVQRAVVPMTENKLTKPTIEVAGRNWLTAELLLRGFEVSTPVVDRGIDLIVFKEIGASGIRSLPLQLKCASAEAFGLDRKYEGRGIPFAFVWHVITNPSVHFLTYEEALDALGIAASSSKSWTQGGKYTVTRKVGRELRKRLEPYEDRWDWLAQRLDAQPPSGVA